MLKVTYHNGTELVTLEKVTRLLFLNNGSEPKIELLYNLNGLYFETLVLPISAMYQVN